MKRFFFLVGVMSLLIGVMNANPVSVQKARLAGERFLSTSSLGQQRGDIQLKMVYAPATRGIVDYYVFNVEGGGFVVVAGDDCVRPVLAYSTTGSFNPNAIADGFGYMLSVYSAEISYVRDHHIRATSDIISEWKSVTTSGEVRAGRKARAVVEPLCQTLWNQNYPWNSQCPEDTAGSGGYVYAGCVATAMGQVMKFHDYPERGIGSHSYYPSGYTQQTANFGDTDYHFELMPLVLDSTSTEEETFYIAQLLHHLGIAVDMQYSGEGSGAYSEDVPDALRNHFGYTCDQVITDYSWWGWGEYTHDQWVAMLKDAGLNEGIPLYYSGSDVTGAGGHAFVCDGYDENDYFHFNWGWSGRDNAWCLFGALHTTKYSFDLMNGFIGHILPQQANYYQRADSVSEFSLLEKGTLSGVAMSWRNPSTDLNGNALTAIESVTVRRGSEVVATLTDAQPGAVMSFEDDNLAPGLYQYSVYVTNASGISRVVYRDVLVGEKCDVVFQLQDQGGDGWKGACISVTNSEGKRIAAVGMDEGSETTVVVPLLKENLNFIWNHGWYHTQEEYDTDSECSFTISDAEGNVLFTSGQLEDGMFMNFDNNCDASALAAFPAQNVSGEYDWNEGAFGALITWEKPLSTNYLADFTVLRKGEGDEWIALTTIPFEGEGAYQYFDNLSDQNAGNYTYIVRTCFSRDEQLACSDSQELMVTVTDVNEALNSQVTVFPNPTDGVLNIEAEGMLRVTVMNVIGQTITEAAAQDKVEINLSHCESGIYIVQVETNNGTVVRKVNVR